MLKQKLISQLSPDNVEILWPARSKMTKSLLPQSSVIPQQLAGKDGFLAEWQILPRYVVPLALLLLLITGGGVKFVLSHSIWLSLLALLIFDIRALWRWVTVLMCRKATLLCTGRRTLVVCLSWRCSLTLAVRWTVLMSMAIGHCKLHTTNSASDTHTYC